MAVPAASDWSVSFAVHLTVAGALVVLSSLRNPGRRLLAWPGGALLAVATWVRLYDVGVAAPEAYTMPTALALLMVVAPAQADDDDDAREQEIARQALLEGRIKPLSEITEKIKPELPGTILGMKLEVEDNGSIIYEFDVVDPSGKLKEVDVDAATGTILKIEDDD